MRTFIRNELKGYMRQKVQVTIQQESCCLVLVCLKPVTTYNHNFITCVTGSICPMYYFELDNIFPKTAKLTKKTQKKSFLNTKHITYSKSLMKQPSQRKRIER